MLNVIDLRSIDGDLARHLPRGGASIAARVRDAVREILADVRSRGDRAVADLTARFDGWQGDDWLVDSQEAKSALEALDPGLRSALERAADQVRWFHSQARPPDWRAQRDGAVVGVTHRPLRRVGVYIPGGLAAYPSTVLMTVVPARVAGVDEVILCTPPGADGAVNPTILAAAALVGADRVLRIGGAQAIAAMAFGTESVPRCDKVVGPGNAYVAEAKQQVAALGACGIDVLAGTTEVVIIADITADPGLVACDLVAQAEHDPLATCLLITPDPGFAEQVSEALADEVQATRHTERIRQALDGQGAAVLVRDLDQAVAAANAFAPEHLEVQTANARELAERVRFAGAVFVGPSSPVALGDYCAGPNHTLPTGGTARFTGGLRTDDFLVPVNWVEYDLEALAGLARVVDTLAEAEDLPAHARAVRARLDRERQHRGSLSAAAEPGSWERASASEPAGGDQAEALE